MVNKLWNVLPPGTTAEEQSRPGRCPSPRRGTVLPAPFSRSSNTTPQCRCGSLRTAIPLAPVTRNGGSQAVLL